MTLYSKYSPKWHGNNSLFSSLNTSANFVQYLTVGTKLTQLKGLKAKLTQHQNVRDQIDTIPKILETKLTQLKALNQTSI